eukprot:TRINITY_DN6340_c0_g2_i2.p1 TRINITY_DN6340_c0_g2~~TRINITY_DN6340_c0_g2_i2.p1  ORF type:complete len:106 (+),score=13.85 TRINITY_DN6340_c0_g2_i2:400-717(+)
MDQRDLLQQPEGQLKHRNTATTGKLKQHEKSWCKFSLWTAMRKTRFCGTCQLLVVVVVVLVVVLVVVVVFALLLLQGREPSWDYPGGGASCLLLSLLLLLICLTD